MVKVKNFACTLLVMFLASALLGCVSQQPETEIPGLSADGKVIYKYMTEDNYKQWEMWPGKGEFYPTQAHGAAFMTTYVNDMALAAIQGKTGTMKEDSVIVKENYDANKTLVALTVMYKEDSYDPQNNDWFYAKYGTDGSVQAEGKVKACIDCHAKVKDNDYIFTSPLK